jgi:3-methyladenine DNA glycosylase AlkD
MQAQADPGRARAMKSYMKAVMPFHGVSLPQVRAISRDVMAAAGDLTCAQWRAEVLALWRGAEFREERYAALVLARDRRYKTCLAPAAMPMLEELVLSGAWWDTVDEVAHLVGEILRAHPREMTRLMREWSTDPNLWKRRVSIICQNAFKRDTDLGLLYANIETNLEDRDFFIRKAIGWALRSYAWTDPHEVARYVHEHESRLSGLSRREALKNVPPEIALT